MKTKVLVFLAAAVMMFVITRSASALTEGFYSTFLGNSAGAANSSDNNENTFIGSGAGATNTTGYFNSFIGRAAGGFSTTGAGNTFVGFKAGLNNAAGIKNSFLGEKAGYFNTGSRNTFLGNAAGYHNTTGDDNSFLGEVAGFSNTGGSYNTSLGRASGYNNTAGNSNVFLGYFAGYSETGSNKLYIDNCSTGNPCTSPLVYGEFDNRIVDIDGALGVSAHGVSKSQVHVSVSGTDVGGWLTSTADANFFMSSGAAYDEAAGGWIQKAAGGKAVVSGSNAAGYRVLTSSGGAVGSPITPVVRFHVNSGGKVGINKTAVGNRAIDTSTGAYLSNGGVWTNASSRELKDNIKELSTEEAIAAVKELNPVTFTYKTEEGEKHAGFIAEDVPDLVATKDRKGLSTMDIVAVLTKVVQEKGQIVDEQQKVLEAQQKDLETLAATVARLEKELNRLKSRDITAKVIERE